MDGHQRKREETSQAADISSSDRTNDRGSSRRGNSSQMPFNVFNTLKVNDSYFSFGVELL